MTSSGIIDLHCDTILGCYSNNIPLKGFSGHINTEKLKIGGAMAEAFSLFIDTDGYTARDGVTAPWDLYKDLLACWKRNMAENSDIIRSAFSAEDIIDNYNQGYISALLTVEDGIEIDGQINRLDEMFNDGVRMLALTWNYENSIGFPNSADPLCHQKGLKPFGFEVVGRMNKLGMIIDVSHLSEGGFWDVAKSSQKPFIASHSCSRFLRDHQRNLTDEQLKAISDCGGMVGINFCSAFLSEDLRNTFAKDIIRHILHLYDIAGIDAIGWGSDFDGIESNMDFNDYTGMPLLLDLLTEHFTDDQIDKINNGNFLRVFREQ